MRRPVVLIVDDDPQVREFLSMLLGESYETITAEGGTEALGAVRSRPVDVVLLDVNLPDLDGIRVLEGVKGFDPDIGVIILSASDNASKAVEALKKGAYDYITKPFDDEELMLTLKRLADTIELKSEVTYLREELNEKLGCSEIISRSANMKRVFELISKVARTSSGVLITGESGTGKELVARAVQSMGARADKPFVAVNCGAVPSELMESELFGHEKGAFTGAHTRKVGKFEYADGGTLFLDEVSTLPMHLQVKLLRVLQERSFERVGSNVPINVDIRIIAATNTDLGELVRQGRFREDLYYRLNVVPIELPPLRDRKDDIPLLIHHFLDVHGRDLNKRIKGIEAEAVNALMGYHWPGNVRELENLIERLVVLAHDGDVIAYEDLPVGMFTSPGADPCDAYCGYEAADSLSEATSSFERRYILGVLNRTGWNRNKAATEMKIHRNTLLHKMKQLRIKPPEDSDEG